MSKHKHKRRRKRKRSSRKSSPTSPLNAVFREVCKYDPGDLLATFASLQLIPENANRTLRLEVYSQVAASSRIQAARPKIGYEELKALFAEDILGKAFGHLEDPQENLFTESITFYGGNYVILPGLFESARFILRHLCMAIFQGAKPFPNADYVAKAHNIIKTALIISDIITRKAGLPRWLAPIENQNGHVVIPDLMRLNQLKQAVTFSFSQLRNFSNEYLLLESGLGELSAPMGSISLSDEIVLEAGLLLKPIVRMHNSYIVGVPGAILTSTVYSLIRLANHYNVIEELADRYCNAVWHSTCKSLGRLGNSIISDFPLPKLDMPCSRDGVFQLDSDKVMYVLLATDTSNQFDTSTIGDPFDARERSSQIYERLKVLPTEIFRSAKGLNDLLCVVIIEGVGRPILYARQNQGTCYPVALDMSAEGLEMISFLEDGNALELWKYANAASKIRATTKISPSAPLDEYQFYRSRNHSYYVSDEAKLSAIAIFPGFAGELRKEVLTKCDFHGVVSYEEGHVIEVASLYGDRDIPIYVPIVDFGRRVSVLVEGLAIPIWVLGPEYKNENGKMQHSFYAQMADAIAYWLWQFTPTITKVIQHAAEKLNRLCIKLNLPPEDEWIQKSKTGGTTDQSPVEVFANADQKEMLVKINPGLSQLLSTEDNEGERVLMRYLLKGLRCFAAEPQISELSDTYIEQALNQHAPLGPKKKIFAIDVCNDPRLWRLSWPRYKKIHQSDRSQILDDISDHLLGVRHAKIGPIESLDKQVAVLNDIVDMLYNKMRSLIASLSPAGLLEWLIIHHEAIVTEAANKRLISTTAPACFDNEHELLKTLARDFPELAASRLASNFLIEYVAATPPSGLHPISLTVYDRLMALASEIVNFGGISDLVKYRLADMEFAILPSGRLGRNPEAFESLRQQYFKSYTAGQVFRAKSSFGWYWREAQVEKSNTDEQLLLLDEATSAEWGVPLSDMANLMAEATAISLESQDHVSVKNETVLLETLSDRLSWTIDKTQTVLDLLILKNRNTFLKPGHPYRKEDVYPWRLDRALSYMRRPFVQRIFEGATDVLWGVGHVYQANTYLLDWSNSGCLTGNSDLVKQLNGRINHARGEAFNDKVGDAFEQYPSFSVRKRVKKVGKLRPPGDIDVLVANQETCTIWIVECKDIKAGRSPHELKTEVFNLFEGTRSKKSSVEKQVQRVKWATNHSTQIAQFLNCNPSIKWKVQGVIITDSELFTPYLRKCPVKIVPYAELDTMLKTMGRNEGQY